MLHRTLSSLSFLALTTCMLLACTASTSEDAELSEGSSANALSTHVLGQADNGKTITVPGGDVIKVSLPANPSTGYEWKITQTNRTFGYGQKEFIEPADRPGGGGYEVFTWKTSPQFSLGTHHVKLGLKRGDGDPVKTFEFTAEVVGAERSERRVTECRFEIAKVCPEGQIDHCLLPEAKPTDIHECVDRPVECRFEILKVCPEGQIDHCELPGAKPTDSHRCVARPSH